MRLGVALRESLRTYDTGQFRADLTAGTLVAIVALPLSMALAIACDLPPQHGLYTAIIAGFLTAALGGSRVQVSGPTAAFAVILLPIVHQFGIGGLLLATGMAGVMMIGLGLARMGRLITFIPYPVTTGFTAGIGVVLATTQVKDFLGLTVARVPEHYVDRVITLAQAMPTTRWPDLAVGALTLTVLLAWPRIFPRAAVRVPGSLVALLLGSVLAWLAVQFVPGFTLSTIGSRFSTIVDGIVVPGVPATLPHFALPWSHAGGDGQPLVVSFELLRVLFPSAVAITVLGAIESLLSAVVADGMTGTRHDPDAELIAQGIANVVSPFFGGFASTGAVARTATNVRAGGRSPVAAMTHAVLLLLAMLVLSPLLSHLPMAGLAAVLVLVAWNVSDAKHFMHMVRVAPRSDLGVMLVCFFLTVIFDMAIAVTAGVILAALLFMRRMAEITGSSLHMEHPASRLPLPPGVVLYRIAGPLFFGAAEKAMSALDQVSQGVRVVIFDLSNVPAMDATGLVALESALDRLHQMDIRVILAGVQPQPKQVLDRAHQHTGEELTYASSVKAALTRASDSATKP